MDRRHSRDESGGDEAEGRPPAKKIRLVTPSKSSGPSGSSSSSPPNNNSPPSAIHVDQLLERTTDAGIKNLLRWSILTGRVGLQELAAAPKKPIRIDNAKICSEGWNGLDRNILANALSLLNLKEKVLCVSRICKSWNKLRHRSELFHDLTDESVPTVDDMSRLIGWLPLPSRSAVTAIKIATSDSDKTSPVSMLARLHAAKTRVNPTLRAPAGDGKKKDMGLIDLQKIVLCGPMVDGLSVHFPLGYGTGPNLRCLVLDGLSRVKSRYMRIDPTKAKDSPLYYLTQLLAKCSGLQVLKMPPPLVSPSGLAHSLGAIGPSDVKATSLRTLDLTMAMSDAAEGSEDLGTVKWSDICCLGKYCPGLEDLKLPAVLEGNDDQMPHVGVSEVEEITPLPALRLCAIRHLESFRPDGLVSCAFALLLRGMPSIEEISIGPGPARFLHASEQRPELGQALQSCSASLRKLYLRGFGLTADSLQGIDTERIESITLNNCTAINNSGDIYAVLQTFQRLSNITSTITKEGDAVCLIKRPQ